MKISRNFKRGYALALAALLALPFVNLMQTKAAGAIIQDRECELTVAVDTTQTVWGSSDYTQTGAGSDDWQYDRTIYLKGEAQPQFGKLTINKTLSNYNETLGLTTSVFEIVGKDAQGNVVYTNVASITHNGAGTESVTIENIPAGITVTVTEVYAGASYEIDGENVKTATIVSDEAVGTGNAEASVAFTNKLNGGHDSGYGLMNEFKAGEDGDWEWTKPTTPGVPQGPAEN